MTNGTDGSNWAQEYLAAAKVYDFSRDPLEPLRSQRFQWTGEGLLFPAGAAHHAALKDLWERYEDGIRCGGDSSDEHLTARMKKIIREACRNKPPSLPLKHIRLDPDDYSVFGLHFGPQYAVSIHTRPEPCYFLALTQFQEGFDWAHKRGRLKVFPPQLLGNMRAYPFHLGANWRAVTNNMRQQELMGVWAELKRQGVPFPAEAAAAGEERQ